MTEPGVRWLDWGAEAFRRAREEGKPILLALVVRWDTWCRLMERDTYGDAHVAMLLNRDFVPVRVDADRRPDVNERYNAGGWPSTVFLTPEGDLLWGAASLDPAQMKQVLVRLRESFHAQRDKLGEAIRERDEKVLRAQQGLHEGAAPDGGEVMARTLRGIARTYDNLSGGFGGAPRFPQVPSLRLLAQAVRESGGEDARRMLARTIDAAGRALYDRVDGGFHRVCAGESWTGVRTEKLAVDNAAQLRLHVEASQVLSEPRHAERARDLAAWAMRVLRDPRTRAFASSQAADDEYYGLDRARRAARTAPELDRTLLTEANAEMAGALLQASAAFGEDEWARAARGALDAVLASCDDARLGVARYHDGAPGGYGLLRDHAYLARALVDGYEHLADERYLAEAARIVARIWNEFAGQDGRLLDRRPGFEALGELRLPRVPLEENAVACQAAARIAIHRDDAGMSERARRTLASFPDFREDYGHHTVEYAFAFDWLTRPATEITIVTSLTDPWAEEMRRAALGSFVPRRVVRWLDTAAHAAEIARRGMDAPRAYVDVGAKRAGSARTPGELAELLRG